MYVLSQVHDPVKKQLIGGMLSNQHKFSVCKVLINYTLRTIVLACIVIWTQIVYRCFQEFVLHTNCLDFEFELGGLIYSYIMSREMYLL